MQKDSQVLPFWKEITAGLISAFFVSPTNAILDKSVIEYANGKATVSQGMKSGFKKMLTTPLLFFTSFKFRWMYFVYGMTYVANNLSDQISYVQGLPLALQNLIFTFVVNTICGISKDKAYAQHFGVAQGSPFPITSLGLFFLRDIITVASAFTFPPILSKQIQQRSNYTEHQSKVIAQLSCPLLIQLFVTPLHLLGLDIYNREGVSLSSRGRKIVEQYPKTAGMRMLRFLPAYGIGGVVNSQLRKKFRD